MLLTIITEKGNTVDVDVALDELDLTREEDAAKLAEAVELAMKQAANEDDVTDEADNADEDDD